MDKDERKDGDIPGRSSPATPSPAVQGRSLDPNSIRQLRRENLELRPSLLSRFEIVRRLSALSWKIWAPPLVVYYAALLVLHFAVVSPALRSWLQLAIIPWVMVTTVFILTRRPLLAIFDWASWALEDFLQWLIHASIPGESKWRLSWPLWCSLAVLALASVIAGRAIGRTLDGRVLACFGAMLLLALIWPRLGKLLLTVRAPLLVALVYHLLLQQDQSLETVRATNESGVALQVGAYVVWGYACAFLGLMLRKLAMGALEEGLGQYYPKAAWLPGILFAAPLLSASYTCWQAGAPTWTGWVFIAMCLLFGLLAILTSVYGLSLSPPAEGKRPPARSLAEDALSLGMPALYLLVPFSIGSFGFAVEPPPAALIACWLVVVAFVIIMVWRLGLLLRLPLIGLLLGWALLLSWLDLNDNHEIAYRLEPSLGLPPLAGQAFGQWLTSPQRRDNPVAFVVVAEGGGARAGYMTALAIEALRTQCSAFRRHHFASIGVSGGSVGAALSAGAPVLPAVGPDCASIASFASARSPAVQAMGSDLLGPTLRGFLFADLSMRFFPGSLWRTGGKAPPDTLQRPWGDRTIDIERRLGLAWAEQGNFTLRDRARFSGLLYDGQPQKWLQDDSFRAAWPGPSGDQPALILLATDVASGRRIGISHLRFWPAQALGTATCLSPAAAAAVPLEIRNRLLTLADIAPGRDPTLIGAALVSARFPLITPAATLPCLEGEWRAVDGGYFENSGLTTALELVDAMRAGTTEQSALRIVLIRIEGSEAVTAPSSSPTAGPSPPATSFAELMSPLRAYGGTREARADQARQSVDELAKQFASGCATKTGPCLQVLQAKLQLKPCHVAIPLGWSLSDAAQADIRQQLGLESSNDGCVKSAAESNLAEFARIMALAAGSALP